MSLRGRVTDWRRAYALTSQRGRGSVLDFKEHWRATVTIGKMRMLASADTALCSDTKDLRGPVNLRMELVHELAVEGLETPVTGGHFCLLL